MKILEMRPYSPDKDKPRGDFDKLSIDLTIKQGKILYVDQYGDIWTGVTRRYVGKIRRE